MASQRVACGLLAVSAFSAAVCFVGPSVPQAAPGAAGPVGQAKLARLASATPEAANAPGGVWSPMAFGVALGLLAAVVGGRPA
eukprot:CAMPEP_0197901018 /NCGR_PEP_ID=MMETSP1439-20131203/50512_1 /TAXON_ID=66791 /ORGANISM="Gonyaulax spinifera, Strain CCMP409" /LENGTH=82 /DNA_ID=CAMNT_0043521967 /DNA_START=56 /DNA_END=301 /DNA_ORIENTATION=+